MAVRYVRNVSRTEAGKASRFTNADCVANTACKLLSSLGQSGLESLCAGKMLAHSRSGNHPCSPVWKTIDGGSIAKVFGMSIRFGESFENLSNCRETPLRFAVFRNPVKSQTKILRTIWREPAELFNRFISAKVHSAQEAGLFRVPADETDLLFRFGIIFFRFHKRYLSDFMKRFKCFPRNALRIRRKHSRFPISTNIPCREFVERLTKSILYVESPT